MDVKERIGNTGLVFMGIDFRTGFVKGSQYMWLDGKVHNGEGKLQLEPNAGAVKNYRVLVNTIRRFGIATVAFTDWHTYMDSEIVANPEDADWKTTYPMHLEAYSYETLPVLGTEARNPLYVGVKSSEAGRDELMELGFIGPQQGYSIDALLSHDGDVGIRKNKTSYLAGNEHSAEVMHALIGSGLRYAILAGGCEDICLDDAVNDNLSLGLRNIVVEDATYLLNPDNAAACRERWASSGVAMVKSAALGRYLQKELGLMPLY